MPYLHYLCDDVPKEICNIFPSDLHLPRLRHNDPWPDTEAEFTYIYDWIVSWGLLNEGSIYQNIVNLNALG